MTFIFDLDAAFKTEESDNRYTGVRELYSDADTGFRQRCRGNSGERRRTEGDVDPECFTGFSGSEEEDTTSYVYSEKEEGFQIQTISGGITDRRTNPKCRRQLQYPVPVSGFMDGPTTSRSNDYSSIINDYGSQTKKVRHQEDFIHDATRNYYYTKTVETGLDRLRRVFSDGFREVSPRKRILHDVYKSNDFSRKCRLDTRWLYQKFTGAILLICHHTDHWHVIHDCSYSNGTCRCIFTEYFNQPNGTDEAHFTRNFFGRRYARTVVSSYEFSSNHWVNLSKYCEKGERHCYYLAVAGRTWIPGSENGHLRFLQDLQSVEGPVVEASGIQNNIPSFFSCRPEMPLDSETIATNSSRSEEITRHSKGDEVITFLQKRPTSPVIRIFDTQAWLCSKYKFYDINSVFMRNCIKIINVFYNDMTFEEIYHHFLTCEPQHLIFNAPFGNIDSYYYSINDSTKILNKLLKFQFNNDKILVRSFLLNVYNVINKLVPKKNTVFVLSEPNGGKNFFFDVFIHFLINFGQMGNFNRYCNFPLMECVNRRVIIWNEPLMEPSAAETLKMVLGGDTVNAKVKFQSDAVITRTPVFVLSNSDIFPKDNAFRSRMFCYRWRECTFLKKYKKKPHPLSAYNILLMYKIINK